MDILKSTAKNDQKRKCTVHSELQYYVCTIQYSNAKMFFNALHTQQEESQRMKNALREQ